MILRDASYDTFGTACAGSRAALDGLPPRLGRQFSINLTGLPAVTGGVVLLGFSDVCFSAGPLPMDLGVINMPGCSLYVSPDASVPFSASGGFGQAGFRIPNGRDLLGRVFYNQAVFYAQGATPANLQVTNAGRGIIGLR